MSVLCQVLFILHGRGTQGIRSPAPGEPAWLYALTLGFGYRVWVHDVLLLMLKKKLIRNRDVSNKSCLSFFVTWKPVNIFNHFVCLGIFRISYFSSVAAGTSGKPRFFSLVVVKEGRQWCFLPSTLRSCKVRKTNVERCLWCTLKDMGCEYYSLWWQLCKIPGEMFKTLMGCVSKQRSPGLAFHCSSAFLSRFLLYFQSLL